MILTTCLYNLKYFVLHLNYFLFSSQLALLSPGRLCQVRTVFYNQWKVLKFIELFFFDNVTQISKSCHGKWLPNTWCSTIISLLFLSIKKLNILSMYFEFCESVVECNKIPQTVGFVEGQFQFVLLIVYSHLIMFYAL